MGTWGGKRKGAGRPPGSKCNQAEDKLTATGRFMEGNALRHQGRPNMYTVDEMRERIAEYLEHCQECEKPATWPGLSLYLGLTRQALWKYRRGECGRDGQAKLYAELLEQVDLFMEAELEGGLQRVKGQTAGIQFALMNRFSADWRQRVEHIDRQTLEVTIDLGRGIEHQESHAIHGELQGSVDTDSDG